MGPGSRADLFASGGGHGGYAEIGDDDDDYDDGYEEPKAPGPTDLRRTDAGWAKTGGSDVGRGMGFRVRR
jgi:hypothetical protein